MASRPPGLFRGQDRKPLPRDEALRNLKDHIDAVVGHFKGKVVGWDVVNEAIGDSEGQYLRDTPAPGRSATTTSSHSSHWMASEPRRSSATMPLPGARAPGGDGRCPGRVPSQRRDGHAGGVAGEVARARRNGGAGVRERRLLRVRQLGRPPRVRQVVGGRLENCRPRRLVPAACRQPPGNDHRRRVGLVAGHAQVRAKAWSTPGSWRPTGVACSPSCANECARPIACSVAGTVPTLKHSDNKHHLQPSSPDSGSTGPKVSWPVPADFARPWASRVSKEMTRRADRPSMSENGAMTGCAWPLRLPGPRRYIPAPPEAASENDSPVRSASFMRPDWTGPSPSARALPSTSKRDWARRPGRSSRRRIEVDRRDDAGVVVDGAGGIKIVRGATVFHGNPPRCWGHAIPAR